ncbi:MAG: ABC transporter permease [Campylobacterota bacterium]|nr:ABC transporter permease [Campylobacterota bacterium]
MRRIVHSVESIGEYTIRAAYSWVEALHFGFTCLLHLFLPKSYNPAMVAVLIRQIYFTAVEILPLFLLIGIIFGSVIIGFVVSQAVAFSLQSQIGTILVGFIMNEFAPFFTVLLISLRSGAAINTEIAVMKVNNELDTLQAYRIDIIDYLFLPRIIGGVISVLILSAIFTVIMLASGYLFSSFFLQMDLDLYLRTLVSAIHVEDLLFLGGKSVAFGFFAMLIPIYSGLKTGSALTAIPISVLGGMIKLFIAIFTVEVFSLLLRLL